MTKQEFCDRFVKEVIRITGGGIFREGGKIEDYARSAAPAYYDDVDVREEGPEACAALDVSYW